MTGPNAVSIDAAAKGCGRPAHSKHIVLSTLALIMASLSATNAQASCPPPAPDCGVCGRVICSSDTGGWDCLPNTLHNGWACDDGNACTIGDTCASGDCIGTPITCTALDQCHDAGTCNPSTGVCSNPAKSNGTSCNDGNACTYSDVCTNGACGGTSYSCTPNQCQASASCNGSGGCTYSKKTNGTSCNDGNACTYSDVCTNGACGGTSYSCTPNQCQASASCTGSGGCTYSNKTNGTSCNDGNACT